MSIHDKFKKVADDICTYVRQWNRSEHPGLSTSFHPGYGGRPVTFHLSVASKNILNFAYSSSFTGGVNINVLYNYMKGNSGYKLLENLIRISWEWHPRTIRSKVLEPALNEFIQSYPRFSRDDDIPRYRSIEECKEAVDTCERHTGRTIPIKIWRSPQGQSETVEYYQSAMYLADQWRRSERLNQFTVQHHETRDRRSRSRDLAEKGVDLDGIKDEAAEEGLACAICFENKPCIAAACNHLVACAQCAKKIQQTPNPRCPKCRGEWTNLRRIFL